MFEWQQESFIPPQAFQNDEKAVDAPSEPSDVYLLLDKQILATMAEDFSKSQGSGDVLSEKNTLDLLSRYLPSNDAELSAVLSRKDAMMDERTAKIGEALPAYFYLKAILSGNSNQEAIKVAEDGIVQHYLEHPSDVVGSYFSALALWRLTEMSKPAWFIAEEKYKGVKSAGKDAEVGEQEPEFIEKLNEYRQYLTERDKRTSLYVNTFRAKIGHDSTIPFPPSISASMPDRIMEAYRTKYPAEFLFPSDKVSGKAFSGALLANKKNVLAMEKAGSKIQISTIVQIDFDNIPGVTLSYPGGLSEYDREVHDALVSLHITGNAVFSPQMVYQALTGNREARLEEKQTEAIRQSINKLMNCKITIDASEEAKARGWTKNVYEGRLIAWEKVTAELNGTTSECYRFLRSPILFEYASKKNQIARADIKLLNSPVNKNEESITLQGYLLRRIMAMNGKSRLNPSILYQSIYEQLHLEATNPVALSKKKAQIRTKVKAILDYWVDQKFISAYKETTKGNIVYSVEILLKETNC